MAERCAGSGSLSSFLLHNKGPDRIQEMCGMQASTRLTGRGRRRNAKQMLCVEPNHTIAAFYPDTTEMLSGFPSQGKLPGYTVPRWAKR